MSDYFRNNGSFQDIDEAEVPYSEYLESFMMMASNDANMSDVYDGQNNTQYLCISANVNVHSYDMTSTDPAITPWHDDSLQYAQAKVDTSIMDPTVPNDLNLQVPEQGHGFRTQSPSGIWVSSTRDTSSVDKTQRDHPVHSLSGFSLNSSGQSTGDEQTSPHSPPPPEASSPVRTRKAPRKRAPPPVIPCLEPVCSVTFSRPSDLLRHYESVHLGIRCNCVVDNCHNNHGKGYCRPEKLKKHQKEVHGI